MSFPPKPLKIVVERLKTAAFKADFGVVYDPLQNAPVSNLGSR